MLLARKKIREPGLRFLLVPQAPDDTVFDFYVAKRCHSWPGPGNRATGSFSSYLVV
jgi:hypothetical protein